MHLKVIILLGDTDLHLVHVGANLIMIFLFEKDALSAKLQDLRFALPLLYYSSLGGYRGSAWRGKKRGLLRF